MAIQSLPHYPGGERLVDLVDSGVLASIGQLLDGHGSIFLLLLVVETSSGVHRAERRASYEMWAGNRLSRSVGALYKLRGVHISDGDAWDTANQRIASHKIRWVRTHPFKRQMTLL